MFASDARSPGLSLRHALAGLQAGVFGSLLMLLWLAAGSLLGGHSIWLTPNLFSTVLFGGSVYRDRYTATSLAGAGLVILAYGLLGAIWGLIWRDSRKPGLTLFGAVTGIVVFFISAKLIWPYLSPSLSVYAPDRQLQIAHLLWGYTLGKSPAFAQRIADLTTDHSTGWPSSQSAKSPEEAPEVIL